VTPGRIVAVDWRDALPGSGEPNKRRPAIVVGSSHLFGDGLPFEIVVPLTGEPKLAIEGASFAIEPTSENGCTKRSYALAWCVQTVSHARLTETRAHVTSDQVEKIRAQIAACISFP
jgi:mRNA-degrading endonuclease toxin of MazEF toxin-antitoxin module